MKSLPNLMTLSRIIILPVFAIGIYFDTPTVRLFMFTLFVILALSDFLDGYVARRYNMYSEFGKIFDPVADKVLVTCILFVLVAREPQIAKMLAIPSLLIITREFSVSGLRELVSGKVTDLPVTRLAKWKTTIQMLSLSFLIIGNDTWLKVPSVDNEYIGIVLLWISAIITLQTGIKYMLKTLHIYQKDGNRVV